MLIAGLQKLTLLDFPGRCAATIFTPGCDMKCPFCHNASLVKDSSVDEFAPASILDFLNERKGRLTGLAITGGEPLLQDGILEFIETVKLSGFDVKLDTNGTFPDKLKMAIDRKLVDYVSMDVKNSWAKYPLTMGVEGPAAEAMIEKVKQSMDILKNSGIEYEFRTTVVKELHEASDIEEMAKTVGPVQHYYLQMFKDSGDILGDECQGGSINLKYSAHSNDTMKQFAEIAARYSPNVKLRGVD